MDSTNNNFNYSNNEHVVAVGGNNNAVINNQAHIIDNTTKCQKYMNAFIKGFCQNGTARACDKLATGCCLLAQAPYTVPVDILMKCSVGCLFCMDKVMLCNNQCNEHDKQIANDMCVTPTKTFFAMIGGGITEIGSIPCVYCEEYNKVHQDQYHQYKSDALAKNIQENKVVKHCIGDVGNNPFMHTDCDICLQGHI